MPASYRNNPTVSFEDDRPDLMNGGPVGAFDGEYVNGHSTNGTNSPSTPGFRHGSNNNNNNNGNHHHAVPPQPRKKKLFSTEDAEAEQQQPPASHYFAAGNRADTWPRCDSPTPTELDGPKAAAAAAAARNGRPQQQHASYPVPPPGPHEGGTSWPRHRTYARSANKSSSVVDDDADATRGRYPRLSRPVELLRSSYDCVVIGSGYGGAVAASRAARAGEEVCVLELGRERWPGEYPVGAASALADLHVSGEVSSGSIFSGMNVDGGDPTGMYHLIFGKGQNAVVCNGELVLRPTLQKSLD